MTAHALTFFFRKFLESIQPPERINFTALIRVGRFVKCHAIHTCICMEVNYYLHFETLFNQSVNTTHRDYLLDFIILQTPSLLYGVTIPYLLRISKIKMIKHNIILTFQRAYIYFFYGFLKGI